MNTAQAHPGAEQPLHGDTAVSLLRMSVAGQVFAVPIDAVREILEVPQLTPLPRTPDFLRGVMNLRGAVVPVLDLGARLGLGRAQLGRRSCVVVVESRGEPEADEPSTTLVLGLLVDAVYEVFDVAGGDIEPVPALGTRVNGRHLSGMTRARGEVIGVLALTQVLSLAELEQLIQQHEVH